MPGVIQQKSPGVFINEINTGAPPISAASTTVAAFVGKYALSPTAKGAGASAPPPALRAARPPRAVRRGDAPVAPLTVVQINNMTDFKAAFGDYTTTPASPTPDPNTTGHINLQEAVFGYFNNGGSTCFVVRYEADTDRPNALAALEPITGISTVLMPGISQKVADDAAKDLISHIEKMKDRMGLFDIADVAPTDSSLTQYQNWTATSQYGALYYPYLEIPDPRTAGATLQIPATGHVAGIYARVDTTRGVHKAPANEPILGVRGPTLAVSQAEQDSLNPQGVNCIRQLNSNILVWGARTFGGLENNAEQGGDFTYVSTRRVVNFLRDSLMAGTQWTVFEPNTPELWGRLITSVTAFLRTVWQSGALFGDKQSDAFFVQCDAETNPPESRAAGNLVAIIGVAVTRPAEFVTFELGQLAAPTAQ